MEIHRIKIFEKFADDVYRDKKRFEVRLNDRDYHEGDLVIFQTVDELGNEINHKINHVVYSIPYVLEGYGIKDGYVVFGLFECRHMGEDTRTSADVIREELLSLKRYGLNLTSYMSELKEHGRTRNYVCLEDVLEVLGYQ